MPLFPTTIAGSLPKPSWLAEPNRLWAPWRSSGEELKRAKRDATLLWLKLQEDAGIDIVGDGEQSRQHFVHGFLEFVEGIDLQRAKVLVMEERGNDFPAVVLCQLDLSLAVAIDAMGNACSMTESHKIQVTRVQ